ncbi:ABC transporter ATP-binding protein [Robertmurraya yapensis]|uniref:ABC transporter ATP-binding protein n=1 Tax=Bacillus yapensis TaxID=2492960 RepID=A0A431W7L1_9BACI|nr:ABC transporter ATP-binding protein [Bacillus yapensis]RTR31441.1 ABC transporter ATP-binding protein [Bacillus yapensis]TKS95665.1 ATP-binding cassette domain-containing protein [Bacillus yapensis]
MQSLISLLKYLKPYTFFAIIGPLFMCVEVGMDLLQPMIMQHIIDNGIATDNTAYVVKMSLLMLLVAIIGLIGGIVCSIYSTKAAVNFATDIRQDVFRRVEKFSAKNTDQFGTGKLITIATNDITSVQMAVMMTLKILVRSPLLFIGSVIIVFISAREFFLILLILIPLLAIVNWYFMKNAGKLFRKVQEAVDKMNTKLQENLTGIRVVKAFGRQDYEKKGFADINEEQTRINTSASQMIMGLMPVMLFLVNIGVVAALWMGVIKVDNGTTEVGVILAFINYLTITLNALISSSHVLMAITRAFPSAERIQQVLNTKMDIENQIETYEPSSIKGDIEFRNVSFSYSKNGELVLKKLNFKARQGEKIGIIGSIGSGKSTLIKLLPRLYDVDTGEIIIDGKNIKEYKLEQLREEIGFIPQRAMLFSGTITENLRFGKEDASKEEMEAATATANASEFIDKLDQRFEHVLTQGGNNLSGGQKQRLSIARALIRKPAILILDDSTSAVDALSEKEILDSLYHEYEQSTTFIIASKISSIMNADRILVMEDGKIVGIGTHRELLEQNNVYQDIYNTQGGKEGMIHESASN